MAMNPYFTGLGKGYDPNPPGAGTGEEWLAR
jgi:hypothetical protein